MSHGSKGMMRTVQRKNCHGEAMVMSKTHCLQGGRKVCCHNNIETLIRAHRLPMYYFTDVNTDKT